MLKYMDFEENLTYIMNIITVLVFLVVTPLVLVNSLLFLAKRKDELVKKKIVKRLIITLAILILDVVIILLVNFKLNSGPII